MTPKKSHWFWKDVDIRDAQECWPWNGGRMGTRRGYGYAMYSGRCVGAHRIAWALCNGRLDILKLGNIVIRHSCDNPICCNPAHLLIGTHKDNSRDAVERELQPWGEAHGATRYSDAQIEDARARVAAGERVAAVAESIGMHRNYLYKIINGEWRVRKSKPLSKV